MSNTTTTTSSPSAIPSLTDTLTSNPKTWQNSSLLSVTQITPSGLTLLYQTTLSMRTLLHQKKGDNRLQHHILSTIFYEPSTRTSCSFQAAMLRLGGNVIHVDSTEGGNTSAGKKGESLTDTVKCMECYSDIIVLRHFDVGSVKTVVECCMKPVINAGDGVGEHPTQALLDLFTILDELTLLEGLNDDDQRQQQRQQLPAEELKIVMLGDLKHGRTVHSLAKLLARSDGCLGTKTKRKISLRYCSPESLKMPRDVKDQIRNSSSDDWVCQEEYIDLKEAIRDADVLYVTRIQKERFGSEDDYKKVEGAYIVDTSLMKEAPAHMVLMHPLPRVTEIAKEVDSDSRAAYFRQMENGMFVRMALLSLLLGKS